MSIAPESIDAYLATLHDDQRIALEALHAMIKSMVRPQQGPHHLHSRRPNG